MVTKAKVSSAEAFFIDQQHNLIQRLKISTASDEVLNLSLPSIGASLKASHQGRGSGKNAWDRQTYAEFASKAERRNPETSFSKDLMDSSFSHVVAKTRNLRHFASTISNAKSFNRMVSRVGVGTNTIDLPQCLIRVLVSR